MTIKLTWIRILLLALCWIALACSTSPKINSNIKSPNKEFNNELLLHKFAIEFPDKPKTAKLRGNEEQGILGGYQFSSISQGYVYYVMYNNFDDRIVRSHSPNSFLNAMMIMVNQAFPGKAVNVNRHQVETWPALIFDFEDNGILVGNGLLCLANNRLYIVACASRSYDPDFKLIGEFIESFRIIN